MAAIALVNQDAYREDFERFIMERREPQALQQLRRDALEKFAAVGIPSPRQEAWRFTDVSALAQVHLSRAGEVPVDAGLLPPPVDKHCHRLVFVNGRYAPGLSRLEALPEGALVASLGQALLTHPELVESHLGQPDLADHPFVALNTAFWEDGAFVWLPRGAVLEAPLQLVFFATGGETVNYPRNLIVMEEASQAVIVEDYRGAGRYLSCPVTEIRLEQGAVLSHHKIQEEDPQAWHLGGLRLHQQQNSSIAAHFLSVNGLLARTDIFALLDGEGADCNLDGLTLVNEGQLGDYHIRVEHAQPHGSSRQLFKGVLAGKARAVFDGLIHVRQNAQKTQAMQNNSNLLLSRRALANSNPRLEILADDVKCNHGSTIGYLDPDALFYLRSRGISEDQARTMLVFAFANDIIEHIQLEPLRERLKNVLIRYLSSDPSTRLSP